MLDIKKTLFKTIWNKLQDLRFLGKNDPDEFRAMISLIIVDDLYDWADYLEDAQSVQKFLKDWRTNHIIKNCFYEKVYSDNMFYTNVNTPQTNHTFRDAWDDQNVVYPSTPSISPTPTPCEIGWKEDPNYTPQLIYFWRQDHLAGDPDYNIGDLTIQERMNVYVNKATNTAYIIPEGSCTWQALQVSADAVSAQQVQDIVNTKIANIGLTNSWTEDNESAVITTTPDTAGSAVLQSISESEIDDLFNE